jgi:16S rRNA processing protein RimM
VITGASGLEGALRVKAFTEDPDGLDRLDALEDDDGRPLALSVRAVRKGVVIAKIEGVTDRDAAERLKGRRLYVPRAALPEPPADEFYHADLIGLRVERPDGVALGTVTAVHNYGAGDLLDVTCENGKTVVLPFTRDQVPVVDIAGGRVVVNPAPGLLPGLLDDGP